MTAQCAKPQSRSRYPAHQWGFCRRDRSSKLVWLRDVPTCGLWSKIRRCKSATRATRRLKIAITSLPATPL